MRVVVVVVVVVRVIKRNRFSFLLNSNKKAISVHLGRVNSSAHSHVMTVREKTRKPPLSPPLPPPPRSSHPPLPPAILDPTSNVIGLVKWQETCWGNLISALSKVGK